MAIKSVSGINVWVRGLKYKGREDGGRKGS